MRFDTAVPPHAKGGWVAVAAAQKNGILEIQVRNSVGSETSSGTGVGLRNTEARLKYLYSGDASVRLMVSEDRIATVSLTLPALNSQPASPESTTATRSHSISFSSRGTARPG
ncbi:MAG: hypothetical protein ABSE28_01605 [Candidatus Sulfotelmatobacter sp.]|jgi:sensor histidine kinase YesM